MISMGNADVRAPTVTRALAWSAAAAIALSLLIMVVVAANGPSVSVPHLTYPAEGPPWWHSLHLRPAVILLSLWAAAVLEPLG